MFMLNWFYPYRNTWVSFLKASSRLAYLVHTNAKTLFSMN